MSNDNGKRACGLSVSRGQADAEQAPRELMLSLCVQDPEVVAELARQPDVTREAYALSALRLGVLAFRQASGMLDSNAIREEGQRLVGSLRDTMNQHATETLTKLNQVVTGYFDPKTGVLPQRLEALVRKDGELQSLLNQYLNGDSSTIAQTLVRHIGEQSAIFKLLSPKQTDGLLAALSESLKTALQAQREAILQQFSLDNDQSALSRLVKEMSDANGELKEELAEDVDKVVKEFSLDNEDGALSRLVSRVEKAQAIMSGEFSLDNKDSALSRLADLLKSTDSAVKASLTLDDDKSPLARLRKELLTVIQEMTKANQVFQTEVRESLAALQARKQEALRSTRHGGEFEEAVGELLQAEAQALGDVFEAVGNTTGIKSHCKKGDHTLTLGQESAAPGAIIVCEAKEDASYKVATALQELEEARQNRRAQLGIFVFSKRTAPAGIPPFQRHGKDIIVAWDREDAQSDIWLRAAVSVARALAVRQQAADAKQATELVELEKAIAALGKDAERITQIRTWATTSQNAAKKIVDEADRIESDLTSQIERLGEYASSQRQATSQG